MGWDGTSWGGGGGQGIRAGVGVKGAGQLEEPKRGGGAGGRVKGQGR